MALLLKGCDEGTHFLPTFNISCGVMCASHLQALPLAAPAAAAVAAVRSAAAVCWRFRSPARRHPKYYHTAITRSALPSLSLVYVQPPPARCPGVCPASST